MDLRGHAAVPQRRSAPGAAASATQSSSADDPAPIRTPLENLTSASAFGPDKLTAEYFEHPGKKGLFQTLFGFDDYRMAMAFFKTSWLDIDPMERFAGARHVSYL
jgi:hypothetical protein